MLERPDAITRLKCFRYAFISRSVGGGSGGSSGDSSDAIFARPNVLTRLAYFLMDVQVCKFMDAYFFMGLTHTWFVLAFKWGMVRSQGETINPCSGEGQYFSCCGCRSRHI